MKNTTFIDGLEVGEVQVLHSAAGYYIGREYYESAFDVWFPYDRISVEYFDTHDDASLALEHNLYTERGKLF